MAPLILLFVLLSFIDFLYTRFMVFGLLERKYGPGELNPFINWLVKHIGRDLGILVGITIPTVCLIAAGIGFRPLLEIALMARLLYFFMQARCLRIELGTTQKRGTLY